MLKLNPEQLRAVETVEGPVLVLAGAGSGKTRVLTQRVAYLIQKGFSEPENILAVTFTNKAAAEMKERISKQLGTNYSLPWVGTFHSICLRILKSNAHHLGYSQQFTIYDSNDQLQSVKDCLKKLQMDTKKVNPRAVLSYISAAKTEMMDPKAYAKYTSGYFQDAVALVYPEYQKLLRNNNAMDFDDLIMNTVLLFQNIPAVLSRYQELFKFILIDEYQDTNHSQYLFAKLLADKHHNICVVGDDAQSIYSFRGATIQNILSFEKDYPEAKVIKLEQNYRSTKNILNASNRIIKLNTNQKPKDLWTENPQGEQIIVYKALDEKDEASWIANEIGSLIDQGVEPIEISVLYRTNAQSRNIEEFLIRAGIDYKIVGNVKFYDRKEVKDILAYLKLIQNPSDNLSVKRIINIPRRGIGPKTISDLEKAAAMSGENIIEYLTNRNEAELSEWNKGVRNFAELAKLLIRIKTELQPDIIIDTIMSDAGYYEYLNDGSPENETRLENISELKSLAQQFKDLPPETGLEEFLDQVSLIEEQYKAEDKLNQKVTLMSIHAAKGLEFDHVFLAGVEEGIFPHSRTYTDPTEMEEERRLAYVAITRAKQKLYLTHADSRTYFGTRNSNMMSRFISDIPEELIDFRSFNNEFGSDWKETSTSNSWGNWDTSQEQEIVSLEKGDEVKHSVFGKGKVLSVDESIVVIKFPIGVKELSVEFAKLEKI